MKIEFAAVLAALGLATAASSASASNLLTNGGFETGDFTGWSFYHSFGVFDTTVESAEVHSGAYAAAFGPGTPREGLEVLEQGLTVTPGASYTISYWTRFIGAGTGYLGIEFGLNTSPAVETLTATVTASTNRAGVRQWASLDAAARWLRGFGLGSAQLELAQWTPQQRRLDF